MPNVTSSLGTATDSMPAVRTDQIGKFRGLHMHYPDLATLNAVAVGTKALWAANQTLTVATEPPSVHRVWDATSLHARAVVLPSGVTVVLASNTSNVFGTNGAPSVGVGTQGDLAVDAAGNAYYVKGVSAWGASSPVFPVTGGGTLTSPGTGLPAVAAIGVDVNGAAMATIANQTGTFASLIGMAGLQGQISVPTDAVGVIRHTGVAGQAQWITSTGSILVIDTSAQTTGTYSANVDGNQHSVYVLFAPTSTVNVTLTIPTTGNPGQEIKVSGSYTNNPSASITLQNAASVMITSISTCEQVTIKWLKSTSVDAWTEIGRIQVAASWDGVAFANGVGIGGGQVKDILGGISIGKFSNVTQDNPAGNGNQVAIGNTSYSLASGGIAVGAGAAVKAGATNGVALGSASAGGIESIGIGTFAQANRDYAVVIGNGTSESNATHLRAFTRQARVYDFLLYKTGISTTTPTELSNSSAAATGDRASGTGNRWYIPTGTSFGVMAFRVTIIGVILGTTGKCFVAHKTLNVLINTTGAISMLGAPVDIVTPVVNGGVTAPTIVFAADDTNKALTVTVTLANSTDGSWRFKVYGTAMHG